MVNSSLSCVSSRENVTPSATMAVDFTPASIFAGGDGIVRHIRSVTKNQERKQVHSFNSRFIWSPRRTIRVNGRRENSVRMCEYFSERKCDEMGCHKLLLSDRGSEFIAQVAQHVYEILGSKKRLTISSHPQTNGCVERLNYTVCQMLSHVVISNQDIGMSMLITTTSVRPRD